MAAVFKILGWSAACVVALIVVIAFAGRETNHYRCVGAVLSNVQESPATLFVEYTRYRFPTTLWADYDGMMVAELPHGRGSGLYHVTDIGAVLTLKDFGAGGGGYWSKLSYAIEVELATVEKLPFQGMCEPFDWPTL